MDRNTAEYSKSRELDSGECLREIFHTISSLLSLRNVREHSVKTDTQYFQIAEDDFAQSFIYERQHVVAPRNMREVFTLSFGLFDLDKPFEKRGLMGILVNTQFDLNTEEVKQTTDLTYTPKLTELLNEVLNMLREEQQKEIDIWNEKI